MRRRRIIRKRAAAEDPLSVALANLIQTQAAFVAEMAQIRREHAELERETKEIISRIFKTLEYHSQMLEALPEAIRQKIGFKPGS
jgi:hypothetical protein